MLVMLCCNLFPCNLFIMWAMHDFPFSTTWCDLIKKMAWSEHENMKLHANFRALLKKNAPNPSEAEFWGSDWDAEPICFVNFSCFFPFASDVSCVFSMKELHGNLFLFPKNDRDHATNERKYIVWKKLLVALIWHMIHEPPVQVPPKTPIPKNTS